MKTATDNLATGQVLETTTRKRIVSAAPDPTERISPDFWEYVEALKPDDWDRHLLYLYRQVDQQNVPLEKCAGYLVGVDGRQVPIADREELELAIAQKYGGRVFRLILKRGRERITEARVYVDAAPKPVQPASDFGPIGGVTVSAMNEATATAQVANKAIDTMASQEHQAVSIGVNAMQAAASIIKNFAEKPAAPADDLTRQVMAVLIQRALAPAPDPLELLTKVLALQQQINPAGNGGNPVVNRVLETAIDKLLNPPPAGPVTSAGAELVRTLPSVAGYVVQAMSEWRAGMEAQRDTTALMRGAPPPPAAARQAVPPPPPQIMPPAASNPQEAPMAMPSLEFIESKIVEIMKEPIPAEEAADDALAFLDRLDPRLIEQLASQGEAGLLNLFQSRPVLRQGTQHNVPRLQEFIRAFLKIAAEAGQELKKPN